VYLDAMKVVMPVRGEELDDTVDAETCERIREMRRNGWWYEYIADALSINSGAVGYHVRAECRHADESLGFEGREKDR
jgi:hypothetical protein